MRLKLFSAFVWGFALGVVALATALWTSGSLHGMVVAEARPGASGGTARQPESARALGMPIAGIDPATLTSDFSEMRNGHPHEALDIMAARGTPVEAVDEGNVVKLFTSKQGGLTVYQFNDARDRCYYYAHLDRYEPGLAEGTLLRRGDVLGYVGSTGNASPASPHLHLAVFELGPEKQWWKGTAIDPLPLLQGKQR